MNLEDVADHPDDDAAGGLSADGIFTSEIAARQRLINNDDAGSLAIIRIGEAASSLDRNAERPKISWRDIAKFDGERLSLCRPTPYKVGGVCKPTPVLKRQNLSESCGAHA